MKNRFQMEFFSGKHGEAFLQIKSHLIAKHTERPRSRPIILLDAVFENVPKENVVLMHGERIVEEKNIYAQQKGQPCDFTHTASC